ncbi:hypothetical protein JYP52_21565 [Nitratireductor aquibiodomus]|uniref:hypothetical protein n=1 Tax=Nitratireductor TaxID=245876 RepID=UPI000DDD3518|nr:MULTISPECIES: hypothetical protein [Nitratireductor]MBN7763731.1 hypothetical protein [Nitratireductor aquibiodomus]
MRSNLEDIDVCMHHQTHSAVLVSDDGNEANAVWIPKSMCELEHKGGRSWVLTAEQGYLEDKGLV